MPFFFTFMNNLVVDILSVPFERMSAKHSKLAPVGEQILYYDSVHLVQQNTNKHTQDSKKKK